VIDRSGRLLEVCGALLADRQQAVRKAAAALATHAIETLTDRFGDGCRRDANSCTNRWVSAFLMFKPI
jgi:hypothetical protein